MRRFAIIQTFTLLVLVITMNAQSIQWQKTIGGSGFEDIRYAQQTDDDGYFLAGYSKSDASGNKTENSKGDNDYWVVKLDSDGEIQWQKTIGGDESDVLWSAKQTTDGGYILGGYSETNISGDKTELARGESDYWIIKLDPIGNIEWQRTIGADRSDILTAVDQTMDGGYIIGGSSDSRAVNDKTEPSKGDNDYWIIKLDAVGNIEWQKVLGGDDFERLLTLKQTSDGGYILGGNSVSNGNGDKTEDNLGDFDCWIVKLDAIGNVEWDKSLGGSQYDETWIIRETNNGDLIVGASSRSDATGNKTEPNYGDYDYWVVMMDMNGNILWQKSYGGSAIDRMTALDLTNDGGFIIGGLTNSGESGIKNEESYGATDYWVLKINNQGDIEWQKSYGGNDQDQLSFVEQTTDEGFMLCGYSRSSISGSKTEDSYGNYDYWLIKLCPYVPIDTLTVTLCPGGLYEFEGELIPTGTTKEFVFTIGFGCDSIKVVEVLADPNYEIPVEYIEANICFGETYNYEGSMLEAGTITEFMLLDPFGCDSMVIVEVIEGTEIEFAITDFPACENGNLGGELKLDSIHGGFAPINFAIDNQNFGTDSIFSNILPGMHTIYAMDSVGCVAQRTVELQVVPKIALLDSIFEIHCTSNSVIIDPVQNVDAFSNLEYNWQNNAAELQLEAFEAGSYTFFASNECEEISKIYQVGIDTACLEEFFYIPNAFAPNGDPRNQNFQAFAADEIDISSYELSIFDRWGALIFYTNDPQSAWNGRKNNQNVLPGLYIYQFKSEFQYGSKILEKEIYGQLTLLR